MAAGGLIPGPLFGVDMAYTMLKSYIDGYGMQVERGSLRITWRGNPILVFSAWVKAGS